MTETISFEDVGMLLGLAAARDQRTTGDADALAWHADLNAAGINYEDAQAALTRFYSHYMARLQPEDRRRVTTPDVISIARKLRSERLENFIYDGDPDESPAQYLARLRNQIEATASGRQQPTGGIPALGGGPHPSVANILAGAFREVPADDDEESAEDVSSVRRPGPLGYDCPECKAAAGRPCRTRFGGKERPPHQVRIETAGGRKRTEEDREREQAEIERRRAASRRALADLPDDAVVEPHDGFRPTQQPGEAS